MRIGSAFLVFFPPAIMRQLKFRSFEGTNMSFHELPEHWMQYTGYKDVDGRDIYEDDIVKAAEYDRVFRVRWGHGSWTMPTAFPMKVLGNIHENSELKEIS